MIAYLVYEPDDFTKVLGIFKYLSDAQTFMSGHDWRLKEIALHSFELIDRTTVNLG